MDKQASQHFDLAIVGGGMVGASLARAASLLGLKTLIIEASSPEITLHTGYDDRAIALAYGSRIILESFGIWPALQAHAAPIHNIHISDRGRFGFTRLAAKDHALEALGYVASGHAMGSALFDGLHEQPGIHMLCPARLTGFNNGESSVELNVESAGTTSQFQCKLLVAADGARSPVREQLGIHATEWSYHQTALIANITPGLPSKGVAYERFTDSGPMAMLPLTDGRYAMVWTLADELVDDIIALPDDRFLQQAQQRFGNRLGQFQATGPRSTYPLKLIRAKELGHGRVLLMGNAAHAVHPITGQGFNLGIRDVAVLADLLYDALSHNDDIGSPSLCQAYAKSRARDQLELALITDGLVRLFTNPLLPLKLIRGLGLTALDNSPVLKHFVARRFMGLEGRLPRPSRGLPLR